MPCPLRTQRRHAFVSLAVLSAFLAAPAVASEIVKCVAKDGSPLYQNFPCDIDSLGSLPSTPSVAKTTMPGTGIRGKSKNESIKVTSPVKSTSASEPRIGMTEDEVRALWGEPQEMVEDEPRSGRVSIWRYADGKLVQFDHKRRVLDVPR